MGMLDRFRRTPQDRFAHEVLRTVRSTGVAEAWYDRENFQIGFRRDKDASNVGWIYLNNVYRESEGGNRAERDLRIARLVEMTINADDQPDGWDDVRGSLRPVLRPATFGLTRPAGATTPMSRPALPFLREFVVVDRPTSMAYVTRSSLDKWGVTEEQVFTRARSNLAGIAALPETEPPDGPVLLRFVESGDAYFVARLLVYGWLASLAGRVGGRPVAFAPDQNTLIVTDDSSDGLEGLFELVEKEYDAAVRGISPAAYTVDEHGEVVPYEAAPGHPLARIAHRAELMLAASEYSAQKQWLDRVEEEAFVATFVVVQRPDESLFSCATWGDNVHALLPKADFVGFSRDTEKPFFVPWETVQREAELQPVEGIDPPRYRVTEWPSDLVVNLLRTAAVEP
jgi:hypothetical protein